MSKKLPNDIDGIERIGKRFQGKATKDDYLTVVEWVKETTMRSQLLAAIIDGKVNFKVVDGEVNYRVTEGFPRMHYIPLKDVKPMAKYLVERDPQTRSEIVKFLIR